MKVLRNPVLYLLVACVIFISSPLVTYADRTVYTTGSGTHYHSKRDCRGLNNAKKIYEDTESNAISRHLTKCSICWSGTSTEKTVEKVETTDKTVATSSDNKGVSSEKVKTADDGTAKIKEVSSDKESVALGAKVKVAGQEYLVTSLGENALKGCANVTVISLPKTLSKIEKNAFSGASSLQTIKLNITESISVNEGAFKGLSTDNMIFKVSKKMSDDEFAKFKKTLKKAGFDGEIKKAL